MYSQCVRIWRHQAQGDRELEQACPFRPIGLMRTIHRFPLKLRDSQVIDMPAHAQPLSVQMKGDVICLWAQVDTDQAPVPRTIEIYGTGRPLPRFEITHDTDPKQDGPRQYLGTVVEDDSFVWHVFEKL